MTICESDLRTRCPLQPLRLNVASGFVTFVNVSNLEFDASDYRLQTVKGSNMFCFPKGTTVSVGATVTVWTGAKATSNLNHPPHSFAWTENEIFSPQGDGVMLMDPHGDTVACVADYPMHEETVDNAMAVVSEAPPEPVDNLAESPAEIAEPAAAPTAAQTESTSS
jgi:hypothetical protein